MSIAARVAPENNDPKLNEREEDDVFGYGPIEIEVEVMDKIILHVKVDAGINHVTFGIICHWTITMEGEISRPKTVQTTRSN